MQVDVLIIGQGLCGTLLSWFLHKEGKSFLVIDDAAEDSSSRIAAGVINPVTGRRYVRTWMAEEVMDFARLAYAELGQYLGISLLSAKTIVDFFPTPQMRNAFIERIEENDTYLRSFPDQNLFNPFFNYDFGCGEIHPAYIVHMQPLLTQWRKLLEEKNSLREEEFHLGELRVKEEGAEYRDIAAKKIVFCNGIAASQLSPFSLLPFSANKGEALVIKCEGLNRDHIFKKGLLLVPMPEEGLFWVGSNYQWEFENTQPTEKFYTATKELLHHWLKKPFEILAHKASLRPATLERRPFVGFHPQAPAVGILNGMGTKGASLAPFFAHQLVQHFVYNFPIAPEADVHRFQRILSK